MSVVILSSGVALIGATRKCGFMEEIPDCWTSFEYPPSILGGPAALQFSFVIDADPSLLCRATPSHLSARFYSEFIASRQFKDSAPGCSCNRYSEQHCIWSSAYLQPSECTTRVCWTALAIYRWVCGRHPLLQISYQVDGCMQLALQPAEFSPVVTKTTHYPVPVSPHVWSVLSTILVLLTSMHVSPAGFCVVQAHSACLSPEIGMHEDPHIQTSLGSDLYPAQAENTKIKISHLCITQCPIFHPRCSNQSLGNEGSLPHIL